MAVQSFVPQPYIPACSLLEWWVDRAKGEIHKSTSSAKWSLQLLWVDMSEAGEIPQPPLRKWGLLWRKWID